MSQASAIYVKAPSNIALVKYWGKINASLQIPANPSLSMTLKKSFSVTEVTESSNAYDEFQFLGEAPITSRDEPQAKIFKHLALLRSQCKTDMRIRVRTRNSFPKGCGIASSASGFAAVTLAALAKYVRAGDLSALEEQGFGLARVADLARQGSGSAARSFFAGFVQWQYDQAAARHLISSVPHAQGLKLADIIVIVDGTEKKVSSSAGHLLAASSPLHALRVAKAEENFVLAKTLLHQGDFQRLGQVIENEAIAMHAVMLTGRESLQYFGAETESLLLWVLEARRRGDLQAYFTLDAGPNVHLLCEINQLEVVTQKIANQFPQYEILVDEMGTGVEIFAGASGHLETVLP